MPPTEVRVFQIAEDDCPFLNWLADLRKSGLKAFTKCLYLVSALEQHGSALRRPISESLRDGIHELRGNVGGMNYRILYGFAGSNVAVVSHGITKEKQVPELEIDLAVERVSLARRNPAKHTVLFKRDKL